MAGEEYLTLAGDPSEPIGGGTGDVADPLGKSLSTPPAPDAPHVRTLGLTVPIGEGEDRIKAISLRPLTMGEVHRFTSAQTIAAFEILSTMAGLPSTVLMDVSWPDGERLIRIATGMLPEAFQEALVSGAAEAQLQPSTI